jgi:lipopolysaccharide/colanic/teichoic acid biosynthesis glycosyltransferase
MGIPIHVAVDRFNVTFARTQQVKFLGMPFLTFETIPDNSILLFAKRCFDIIFSSLGLVILFPLFIFTAAIIKLTSEGPILFVQKRVGINGRIFLLYKFRTMIENAESKIEELLDRNEMKGPIFKITNDPRLTPIGAFLRKSSIDELPQLWNVLIGDMSLVGPLLPCRMKSRSMIAASGDA